MADANAAANTILKILSGVQAGVEVSLASGDYVIGAGSDDDIQVIDVSLKPGHAKLRVSPGKIEIAAAAGSLKSGNGIALETGSDWQEIEPLDVVTAGTTRFALGPITAQWPSIGEGDAEEKSPKSARPKRATVKPGVAANTGWWPRGRQLAIPLVSLALLAGVLAWHLTSGQANPFASARPAGVTDLDVMRAAVAQFPFADAVEVRQDVDATIYVNGYVELPVERRALATAVEKTGIPARVRIWILQVLRSEVDNLISSEGVNVTHSVSRKGELTLEGVILKENAATAFVTLLKDRILGIARLDNRIKTSKSLLGEVEKLAVVSQIQPYILLREDGEQIEATGLIPLEKADSWVGFLQSYAKRFAKDIRLRSYVQLQGPGSVVVGANNDPRNYQALVIGAGPGRRGRSGAGPGTGDDPAQNTTDIILDAERLRQGLYGPGDVFVGPNQPPAITGNVAAGGDNANDPGRRPAPRPKAGQNGNNADGAQVVSVSGDPPPAPKAAGAANGGPSKADEAGAKLTERARSLLEKWRDGQLPPGENEKALKAALEILQLSSLASGEVVAAGATPGAAPAGPGAPKGKNSAAAPKGKNAATGTEEEPNAGTNNAAPGGGNLTPEQQRRQFVARYLPLMGVRRTGDTTRPCWADSQLTPLNLPAALFWLDLLSVTEELTLNTFDKDVQAVMLEAALNPRRATQCAKRLTAGNPAPRSLYLREIARNADFIRFITRDLQPFPLDITGAYLGPQSRFVQVRSGRKLQEGAAPDLASRLALVGELGVAVQVEEGLSTVVFGPEMNWLME